MTRTFATILILLLAATTYAQMPAGTSNWKNDRGTKLVLEASKDGMLTGTFTTAVGCGAGRPRRVIGTTNGYAIAFVVNFEECGSVTAWNGVIVPGDAPQLKTLWHLTRGKNPPAWDSTLAGTDVFTPDATPKKPE
jgi:hypothetical protein